MAEAKLPEEDGMSLYQFKGQIMTAEEAAKRLGDITTSGVDRATRSALKKLRRSPTLFLQWLEMAQERKSNNIGTEI